MPPHRGLLCAATLSVVLAPAPARADGLAELFVALGAGGFAVGVDSYYTARTYIDPDRMTDGLAKGAIACTAWQPAILYPLTFFTEERFGLGPTFAAAAAWPISITANGLARLDPSSTAQRNVALTMVGAADAVLVTYDVLSLAEAWRRGAPYAAFETLVGLLQTAYAIQVAVSEPADRTLALSLGAVPAALATHGVLTLVLPKGPDSRRRDDWSVSVPVLVATPLPAGAMVHAAATW
jgi:hypothetical protein